MSMKHRQPINWCVFCKKVHRKYFELVARPAYWCPGCTSCNFDSTVPEVNKPISYIHFTSLGYFQWILPGLLELLMARLYPYSAHTCSLGKSGGFLDGSSETTNSQFSHSSLAPAIVFKGLVFDSVPHSFQGAMQNVSLRNYGHIWSPFFALT